MKKTNFANKVVSAVVFLSVLFGLTIIMTIIWDFTLHERVYNCTDSVPFGYLNPGGWVHGEIIYVDEIVDNVPMSDPDSILSGWSLSKLWTIWISMFGGSLILSYICAWALAKPLKNNVVEQVAASDR